MGLFKKLFGSKPEVIADDDCKGKDYDWFFSESGKKCFEEYAQNNDEVMDEFLSCVSEEEKDYFRLKVLVVAKSREKKWLTGYFYYFLQALAKNERENPSLQVYTFESNSECVSRDCLAMLLLCMVEVVQKRDLSWPECLNEKKNVFLSFAAKQRIYLKPFNFYDDSNHRSIFLQELVYVINCFYNENFDATQEKWLFEEKFLRDQWRKIRTREQFAQLAAKNAKYPSCLSGNN